MIPYAINLEFGKALPKLQPDTFSKWQVRNAYRAKWAKRVFGEVLAAGGKPKEPLNRARINCIRFSRGPEPDFDNLVISFKCLIDAIVKMGVLVDDSPKVLVKQTYAWEHTLPADSHVMIKIREDSSNVRTKEW